MENNIQDELKKIDKTVAELEVQDLEALEQKLKELKAQAKAQNVSAAQQNNLFVPAAIVIAGIIVAGAIMLNNGKNQSAPVAGNTANTVVDNNAVAPTRPSPAQPAGIVKPVTKDDHILGNPNAQVFLIEYSDFECTYCKRFHPTTKQIVDAYKGKVAIVYRHFPLGFHANAQKQAEATECAAELGGNDAFWKYTDAIFDRTTSGGTGFALSKLTPLAEELGLDKIKFNTCLDSGKYAAKVKQDMAEGTQAGVTGTPGNILWTKDGKVKLMPGSLPFEIFKQEIDQWVK